MARRRAASFSNCAVIRWLTVHMATPNKSIIVATTGAITLVLKLSWRCCLSFSIIYDNHQRRVIGICFLGYAVSYSDLVIPLTGWGRPLIPRTKSTFSSQVSGTVLSLVWLGNRSCQALRL